jgi:hypothetical protein
MKIPKKKDLSQTTKSSTTVWVSRTSSLPRGAATAMAEPKPEYPSNPPRFRKAPTTPAESLTAGSCDTCISFHNIGFCVRYQTSVAADNLCDGYVSVIKTGKRQWARP